MLSPILTAPMRDYFVGTQKVLKKKWNNSWYDFIVILSGCLLLLGGMKNCCDYCCAGKCSTCMLKAAKSKEEMYATNNNVLNLLSSSLASRIESCARDAYMMMMMDDEWWMMWSHLSQSRYIFFFRVFCITYMWFVVESKTFIFFVAILTAKRRKIRYFVRQHNKKMVSFNITYRMKSPAPHPKPTARK